MREWVEEISEYMQEREEVTTSLVDLSEEIHQASLEAELLLQASNELQSAFSSILGKLDHADR
jgi:hypothetical protein